MYSQVQDNRLLCMYVDGLQMSLSLYIEQAAIQSSVETRYLEGRTAVFSSTTLVKDYLRRTISMAMHWLESGSRRTAIQSCGETRFTTERKGACASSTVGEDCWRKMIFSTMHSQVSVCVCVRVRMHVCVCMCGRKEGKRYWMLCVFVSKREMESRLARDDGRKENRVLHVHRVHS